jgi:hypothetical protein
MTAPGAELWELALLVAAGALSTVGGGGLVLGQLTLLSHGPLLESLLLIKLLATAADGASWLGLRRAVRGGPCLPVPRGRALAYVLYVGVIGWGAASLWLATADPARGSALPARLLAGKRLAFCTNAGVVCLLLTLAVAGRTALPLDSSALVWLLLPYAGGAFAAAALLRWLPPASRWGSAWRHPRRALGVTSA